MKMLHTARTKHQMICIHICLRICLCILCDLGLGKKKLLMLFSTKCFSRNGSVACFVEPTPCIWLSRRFFLLFALLQIENRTNVPLWLEPKHYEWIFICLFTCAETNSEQICFSSNMGWWRLHQWHSGIRLYPGIWPSVDTSSCRIRHQSFSWYGGWNWFFWTNISERWKQIKTNPFWVRIAENKPTVASS